MTAVANVPVGGRRAPQPVVPAQARRTPLPYLLLLPGLLWLGLFFVVPTVALASQSLQTGSLEQGYVQSFRWANYTDALAEYYPQFLRSLGYAGTATVLCLLIAYPVAYTIAFRAGRWRNLLLVLVIAPFFTSFLIRTLAWQTILSDGGVVVHWMGKLGLLDVLQWLRLTDGSRLLATPAAVVCGLTYNFLPFMILPLYASLEGVDPRLIEAGGDLYATPITTFRTVTLPLSRPGVVAGTLLTFIPASGDYINAALLGTPRQYMIGNVVQSRFLTVLDYPTAAALSFILMVAIVALVSVYLRRAGTEDVV